MLDICCVLFTWLYVCWEFVCMEGNLMKLCLQSLCYMISVQLQCIMFKSFLGITQTQLKGFSPVFCACQLFYRWLCWHGHIQWKSGWVWAARVPHVCDWIRFRYSGTLSIVKIIYLFNKLLFIYTNFFTFITMYLCTCYSQIHHCGHCWAFVKRVLCMVFCCRWHSLWYVIAVFSFVLLSISYG